MKLAGVIYVHRISDDRFGGLAAKNFKMFRELCGEKTLKNVALMTNMWGRVTPEQGADRERQLRDKHFKAAIDKGAQLCRFTNTPESARAILRKVLKNRPAVLEIQRELIDEHKDIGQTRAGEELSRDIHGMIARYQGDIKELEEGMRMAEDEEYWEEMEGEKRRLEEQMKELRKDLEDMRSKFEEARREMEERITVKFEKRLRLMEEEHEEEIRRYEDRIKTLEREARRGSPKASGWKWGCAIM